MSPTLRVSPVQTYIKKITIQLNNSKELNDHEEETKINKTQRFSPKLLALTELKSSFNDHTTSNELSSLKKSSIAKETKNMKESIKFNNLQSKAENNSNFHVCIPQNPFSQVTIDYNSDAEKIAFKQVKEDRFEGQTNFNYSFNPRKEKKIDRDFDYPEIISKIQKNDMFEAAGFALNDSISLKPNNNFSQFDVFEIKKGESVCIRLYKEDSAFIECKFYEKIGIFKKKDFYFWENKMSFNQKDEDISSPTSQDGPMKPKFFKTSHR